MGTQKRVIEQLKKDLLSNDDQVIKKALIKIRAKGNELLIDPLIELYSNSESLTIKEEIKSIFSEIKNDHSTDFLTPYLKSENNEIKELVLYALWSSGIDMNDHIEKVVEAACNGNFMVILEALTVLENLEGPFSQDALFNASTLLQEQLHELPNGSEKDLLQSMHEVIQQFENQTDFH